MTGPGPATRTRRSTLDGWVPEPGTMVWQQMYDLQRPKHDSTIQERIAAGRTYGERFLTKVVGCIVGDGKNGFAAGIVRFHTQDPKSGHGIFPSKGHGPSWTESDWCVLEDASEESGMLW